MYKYCFLLLLLLTSNSAFAKLQSPVNTVISDSEFKQWVQQYENRKTVVEELLDSAGIHLSSPLYLNTLINEASPYLLRHAVNPINWQAWSDASLASAKQQNKLIFLSIGYSTCHWCHVMEKESFVDIEVAKSLNSDYVNLKVDRELQPEIDSFFTHALTTVKGSAGWPITAVLTPEGKIIWIDSYVNKQTLLRVTQRFSKIWQTQPRRLQQVAKNIHQELDSLAAQVSSKWSKDLVFSHIQNTLASLDNEQGGQVGAPKFPNEALLLSTLEHYAKNPTETLKTQLTLWLNNLSKRGIRDHVHGGFHRYATDAVWQVPHYEKMLYNQALLIKAFAKAGYLLNRDDYVLVAKKTANFVDRVMRTSTGGYYSAIDADYANQEGRYYLFSSKEKAQLDLSIQEGFGWYQYKDKPYFAPYIEGDSPTEESKIAIRQVRSSLALPHIDKKILLSWNALLVDAFSELYLVTKDKAYLNKAQQLLNFIENNFYRENQLVRAYYLSEQQGNAVFEDYVYLAQAYHSLFIATFDQTVRQKAISILRQMSDPNTLTIDYRTIADGELVSPHAIYAYLLNQYAFSESAIAKANRKHKTELKNAYLRMPTVAFSAASILADVWQTAPCFIFAQGNGHVCLQNDSNGDQALSINMAPGWHINSHTPNEKSLIATKVTIDGELVTSKSFPKPVEKQLGFSQQPLSLFENSIEVSLTEGKGQWVELTLQACSDKVCLLPEAYRFFTQRK